MKIKKTYTLIPADKVSDFIRLFPAARVHAWPNTWSYPTNLKAAVDAFLATGLSAENVPAIVEEEEEEEPPPAPSTGPILAIALSRDQIHALEHLLRRLTAGTVEAIGRDANERAAMQSALTVVKSVLRKELARV